MIKMIDICGFSLMYSSGDNVLKWSGMVIDATQHDYYGDDLRCPIVAIYTELNEVALDSEWE